jgi:hypothetical protein
MESNCDLKAERQMPFGTGSFLPSGSGAQSALWAWIASCHVALHGIRHLNAERDLLRESGKPIDRRLACSGKAW